MIAADSASVRPVTPTFIPQTDRSLSPCTQPIPADSSNAVLSVIERQSHLGNRIPETPPNTTHYSEDPQRTFSW